MQPTLAFAPTPDDLDDDLFSVPVLTFAPPPAPEHEEES
jgi:hypothetical protein